MPSPLIMVAPNGARRSKADHPALPMTADELAQTARACQRAGAGAIHLHVRDAEGRHSLDAALYRRALEAIAQAAPGLLCQVTTESGGLFDVAGQLACLQQLCPDWASVAVREVARDPALAQRLYAFAADQGVRIQHILYDDSCLSQLEAWRRSGVVRPGQDEVILVLGRYAPPVAAHPGLLDSWLARLSGQELAWSVCAFGPQERACLLAAMRHGGNVRIGFENNIHTPDQQLLPDNATSVAALVAEARAKGVLLPASAA